MFGNQRWMNGYMLLTGDALKEFVAQFDKEMDFPIKTVRLGIFDFRSLSIVENPDGFLTQAAVLSSC